MSNSASHFLELKDVSRRFGETVAIDRLSLSIGRGEVICLVGRSGCGKSTLLRAIAGVDVIDGGSIRLNGQEVTGPSAFIEPEKRKIGFVFQDYALFPHLSVRENIVFGLKTMPRQMAQTLADEMLDRIGIRHLEMRFPHMLSGGEQQRVALARALAPKPDLILMDEPFSNLDRGLRDHVREETLSLLRGLGTTVVMVTHDPEEALSSGDRVVLLKDGRIMQVGTGRELYDAPANPYAAEFFGTFNRIPGLYRDGIVETVIGNFPNVTNMPEGTAAIVYLRPQDLVIDAAAGMTGNVLKRRFMGDSEQFTLDIRDLAEPLFLQTRERLDADTATVSFAVRRENSLVFASQ